MQVAFYIGSQGTWIDRAIAAHDSGRFSHAELVFDLNFPRNQGLSLCFSSSQRDGGTRFKYIDLSSGKWVLVDVPQVDRQLEALIYSWCLTQKNRKYDLAGVLAFKLPFRQDGGRWFCSEVSLAGLQQVGLYPGLKPHRYSPNALHRLLTRPARPAIEANHDDIGRLLDEVDRRAA